MALEIIWSKKAAAGYAKILKHLDENWTAKEVKHFEQEMEKFFDTLSKQPHILEESKKKKFRRGPINKLTLLTYQKKNQLQLISVRGTRHRSQH